MSSPTSLKLDSALKEQIQHLAQIQQRSAHWIMRKAIEQYVEQELKKESFNQAAMQAWNDYQETGISADGDEVLAWIESWGDENEKEIPKCRK